jgi:hypothetical protein
VEVTGTGAVGVTKGESPVARRIGLADMKLTTMTKLRIGEYLNLCRVVFETEVALVGTGKTFIDNDRTGGLRWS